MMHQKRAQEGSFPSSVASSAKKHDLVQRMLEERRIARSECADSSHYENSSQKGGNMYEDVRRLESALNQADDQVHHYTERGKEQDSNFFTG